MDRYEEIRWRLADGRGVREIAQALGCARATVRKVRDGQIGSPRVSKVQADPLWMSQLDWPPIIHDLGARGSAEVHPGGEGSAAHDVLELLEAVLPQVPRISGSVGGGARFHARGAR